MSRSMLLFLVVALLLGLTPVVEADEAASYGYVTYTVSASSDGHQQSFSVNESISKSPSQGESILSLVVESASSNFTYSHLLNSSLAVFPYLPATTNLSFAYKNDSYYLAVRITEEENSEVTFQGKGYTLGDYRFDANLTEGGSSKSVDGNLSLFPSDLVYSVMLLSGDTIATATLTSTSLQLQANSSLSSAQVVSAGVGVSAGAAAVALSLGVGVRRKKKSEEAQKPEHWVD